MALHRGRHDGGEGGISGESISAGSVIDHYDIGPIGIIRVITLANIAPRVYQLITQDDRSHAIRVGHAGRNDDLLTAGRLLGKMLNLPYRRRRDGWLGN